MYTAERSKRERLMLHKQRRNATSTTYIVLKIEGRNANVNRIHKK